MNEINKISKRTRRKQIKMRVKAGIRAMCKSRWKCFMTLLPLLLGAALLLFLSSTLGTNEHSALIRILLRIIDLTIVLLSAFLSLLVLLRLGTPFGSTTIQDNFKRIGFTNKMGESPIFLAKFPDSKNSRITIYEFGNCLLPRSKWEQEIENLEKAVRASIVKIRDSENRDNIDLSTTSLDMAFQSVLYWQDRYLQNINSCLVLGESLIQQVVVDLERTPMILLGGSTGSGKSVLLKVLLYQAITLPNTIVHLADFKGGIDYSIKWHVELNMITQIGPLLQLLHNLVAEMERRKVMFKQSEVNTLSLYNNIENQNLPRIFLGFDEIAEVLDKNGVSKERKEEICKIEGFLSTIARQGRAYGIHLILSTQRPDANVLTGQIKSNLDYRICGKADSTLSKIILDNTSAAESIPKVSQGRFITHDGTVFQGYLLDENIIFKEAKRDE